MRVAGPATSQNNTFDFNDYFSTAALRIDWGDKEFSDFDAFRKATGQEARGFLADPRLKGLGRGGLGRLPLDAYRLRPGSPCFRTGTEYAQDYGTQDYWGKLLHDLTRMNVGPEQ